MSGWWFRFRYGITKLVKLLRAPIASICISAMFVLAQAQPVAKAAQDGSHLDLVLERNEAGVWKAIDPQTVLNGGDAIRFRITSSFPGYLYAYYRGSADEAAWLYPVKGSQSSNRIESGVSYVIPSETTSYAIAGQPGFDIVYWLISPTPMSGMDWLPKDEERAPRTAIPRCREDLDKVVAACHDDRAGAVEVSKTASGGGLQGGMKARELKLNSNGQSTRIEAQNGPGLIVYEFRIAHR